MRITRFTVGLKSLQIKLQANPRVSAEHKKLTAQFRIGADAVGRRSMPSPTGAVKSRASFASHCALACIITLKQAPSIFMVSFIIQSVIANELLKRGGDSLCWSD
jgi:hypothetical protein